MRARDPPPGHSRPRRLRGRPASPRPLLGDHAEGHGLQDTDTTQTTDTAYVDYKALHDTGTLHIFLIF